MTTVSEVTGVREGRSAKGRGQEAWGAFHFRRIQTAKKGRQLAILQALAGAVVSGAVREFAPFSGGMLAIVGTRTN